MSHSASIAHTPPPPYIAVIFTNRRAPGNEREYQAAAERMVDLGSRYEGFLGIESVRGADGVGITVSYWRDEACLLAWKRDTEHQQAQRAGRNAWYDRYEVRIARVERAYGFARPADS